MNNEQIVFVIVIKFADLRVMTMMTLMTLRRLNMRNITHQFIILVGGNRGSKRYIVEEHAYSEKDAIKRANELSSLYPLSEISVEHWLLKYSANFLTSGLYKGEVFNVRKERAA